MRAHTGLRIVLVALLGASLTGCLAMREVPVPSPDRPNYDLRLKPGRKIEATLKDGTVQKFRLVKQEPGTLVGDNVRVTYPEIDKLKVQRISVVRTSATAGVLGYVGLVLLLAFAMAGG